MEELPFLDSGNLPLQIDPKLAWAIQNIGQEKLIEINTASREKLLRIPGIGPAGVNAILSARSYSKLVDLSNLSKLGIQTRKAAPFILLNGKRPPHQPTLIDC
jgi:predicted DNA-binding helix-hairpin-helix protein